MKNKKGNVFVVAMIATAVLLLFFLVSLALGVVAYTNVSVLSTGEDIIENINEKEWDIDYDCILVLGAGLRSDGTPSDMLADRLKVAYELYVMGVSDVIVLSGDRSGEDYDEVSAMRTYLENMGVPADAMIEDGKGYSTYESIANLKQTDEYDKVVIVTQKYHLYRAMYIAEKMGISADGADAELRGYRNQLYRDFREIAARTKDYFMVKLSGEAL